MLDNVYKGGDVAESILTHRPTTRKEFRRGTVTIAGGSSQSLGLGTYNNSEPEPVFDVTFDPDTHGEVSVLFERLDIPGKACSLHLCRLRNDGDKRCEVTVARRSKDVG